MGFFERHMGKILLALILVSGPAALLFGYDLYRTIGIDTSPSAPVTTTQPHDGVLEIPRLKPKAQYDLIAKRNLFVFPEDAVAKKAPSAAPGDIPKKETTLNVSLNGTIVSPNGFAVAFIEDRVRRKEDLYIVGDRIQDAEILKIEKERVTLKRAGGQEETLTIFTEDKGGRSRPESLARTVGPRPSTPSRKGRSPSPERASSSRNIQQKIRSLMAQLRLRPHFDKGKPAGFKVGQVTSGSAFEAAGLRNGDIIVTINDEDVRTPNQLMSAYRVVAEDEELWLGIVREGGEEDTIEIDVERILPEK